MTESPITAARETVQAVPTKPGVLAVVSNRVLQYAFLLVFIGMTVFFSVTAPVFFTPGSLGHILQSGALLLLVALALTGVIASGGIDLSVGVALDFGAWFSVISVVTFGLPWPLAIVAGLLGGALIGCVNAFLIVGLGVTPFLATLGTFFMGRSVQQIATNGGANIGFRQAPEALHEFSAGSVAGVSHQVIIAAVAALLCFLLLGRSKYGARLNVIGIQYRAARVAGIPTRKYRVAIYIASGVLASAAGVLLAANLRIYTPLTGFSYLLDGIAAVFIGASLHRDARPNVAGTVIGVLFLSTLRVGLDLLGLDFNLKAALSGLVLLAALALAFAVSQHSQRAGIDVSPRRSE